MTSGLPNATVLLERHRVAAAAWTIEGETVTATQGVDWIGRPVTSDSLFAAYCTTKPMVACGILALVQDEVLSLDETVGAVLGDQMTDDLSSTRIYDLLRHTSRPQFVGAIGIRALPEPLRWPYICESATAGAADVAYGEAEPWYVIAKLIERRSGVAFHTFVHERINARFGIGRDAVVLCEPSDQDLDRVAVSGVVLDGTDYVALSEVTRPNAAAWNPPSEVS